MGWYNTSKTTLAMSKNSEHSSSAYCIFQQPWWLEAVAPGQWKIIEVKQGDKVTAALPYIIQKQFGLTLLIMPPLTQMLGPWIADIPGKYATRLSREKELMNSLIGQLPPFDYFKQNFHYSIDNWLPFYWKGFEQTTRYTYVLEDLTDTDRLWNNFTGSTRREIRKAEKQVTVTKEHEPELIWGLHRRTLNRKNASTREDFELFSRIFEASTSRNQGQLFMARDAGENIHAALFLVWDRHSAYYLMGGAADRFRTSGAQSLLMWEAIKFASDKTNTFDFEGSMLEPVERFFRGFGARQRPYFQITKMSRKAGLLIHSRNLVQSLLGSNR